MMAFTPALPLFHDAEKTLKCEFPIDVPLPLFESLSSSSVSLLSLFFLSHVIEGINVFFFP